MIKIEMPMEDYTFLKQYYDDLDRYIVRMEYDIENIVLHIQNERFNEFRLDFNSMIVRKGTEEGDILTPEGIRMNRILQEYVLPSAETGKE